MEREACTEEAVRRLPPAQARLLDLIESRDPLPVLLDTLSRYVESLYFGIRSSILLADPAGVLVHGAAPSLSAEYIRSIDRLPIREGVGSCGTAAARREMVIVEDVAASPLWRNHLDLARAHGIAACWSIPIITAAGELLGTCAMYYAEPRAPTKAEIELIYFIGSLAAIVIQRHRELERLATDAAQYRQLAETSPDAVIAHREGWVIYFNAAAARLLPLTDDPADEPSLADLMPDEWAQLGAHHGGVRATRLRRPDGTWIELEIAASEVSIHGRAATLWVCRDVTQRATLEQAILDASSREQERLGYELHDGLGQQLTGISLLLHAVERKVVPVQPDTAKAFAELVSLLAQSIEDTRNLALALSPVVVDRAGLAGALQGLAALINRFHQLECLIKIDSAALVALDPVVATHLYRIAQEAVQNVVRHARARRIFIELSCESSVLAMTVRDDGDGIGGRTDGSCGIGLQSMEYRTRRIGGRFRIEPCAPHGTEVRVSYPLLVSRA